MCLTGLQTCVGVSSEPQMARGPRRSLAEQDEGCSEKRYGGCYLKVYSSPNLLTSHSPWQLVCTLERKILLSKSAVTPRAQATQLWGPSGHIRISGGGVCLSCSEVVMI